MNDKTIGDILESPYGSDCCFQKWCAIPGCTHAKPVTIWLSTEAKVKYDQLQKQTRRKFSKKAREALLALIDMAEARAG